MFDPSISLNPAAKAQRQMVASAIRAAISSGTFTYTELLSSQEPMRTMGLEYLDGVTMTSGNIPGSGGEIENWGGARIRLVAIDPAKPIKAGTIQQVPIAGTFETKPEKVMQVYGDIADMTDIGPHERLARYILVQRGWPIVQNRRGNRTADVVEWRWLEKAALGENPAPGVVELYEQLLPRVEAFEAAQAKKAEEAANKAAEARKSKTKSAATAQPGV